MPPIECFAALNPSEQLKPWSYDSGELQEDHVLISIECCGVCHSDVCQIYDEWQAASFPLVPGHEIVGTIAAVGSAVTARKVGERVGVGPQRSNCGSCDACACGADNVCPAIRKTYAGPGKDKGGFAKQIQMPFSWVFPIPESLPSEAAAPLLCAGITTFSPLKRHLVQGAAIGILGIGGLGHVALQFAAKMGYGSVTAISSSKSKEAEARSFGASAFLDMTDPASVAAAKGSLDIILCTASGDLDWGSYLALLKPRGKLVNAGLPPVSAPMAFVAQLCVCSERAVIGSFLGPNADYEEMLRFAAENEIAPKIEVLPFDQVNVAVEKCKLNTARYRMVLKH
mmetsp:Transcript_6155/g.20711  ORF Transcript_6155/g.20711 Transcript_6155/m.20711 type:complete len:341 (+) Transcript_6155:6-1028(+)